MLFAGFNVSDGEYSLFAAVAVGSIANLVGSWIAYARGLLRPRRHPREARQEAPHQEEPPRVGRPLVRAPRRRHRLLHPHAPDHPHVHLAARGRRADAVLALQRVHARRLRAVGAHAHLHRQAGRATTGRTGRTRCTTSTTSWPRASSAAWSTCSCGAGAAARRAIRPPRPPDGGPEPNRWRSRTGAGGGARSPYLGAAPHGDHGLDPSAGVPADMAFNGLVRGDRPVPTALPGDPPSRAAASTCATTRASTPRCSWSSTPSAARWSRRAAWFASPIVERAIAPHLSRPFDHRHAGPRGDRARPRAAAVPDAGRLVGGGRAAASPGRARGGRRRRRGGLGGAAAGVADRLPGAGPARAHASACWRWPRSTPPARSSARDLATVTVLRRPGRAGARARGAWSRPRRARQRREALLKRAGGGHRRARSRSPRSSGRWWSTPCELVGADRVVLSRSPGHRHAAAVGTADGGRSAADLTAAGAPASARRSAADAVHVPVALGPRLFGVLSAVRGAGRAVRATTRPTCSAGWRAARPRPSPTRSTSTASGASRARSRAASCPTRCPSSPG